MGTLLLEARRAVERLSIHPGEIGCSKTVVVQSSSIGIPLELPVVRSQVLQILSLVGVDFFALQRLDEGFRSASGP